MENDARSFKILILSGIPDAHTKMYVSEAGSCVLKTETSNTAPNIHRALLPLFTHYKGNNNNCICKVKILK